MTALDRQVEHLAVVFLQQLVTLRAQNQILEWPSSGSQSTLTFMSEMPR